MAEKAICPICSTPDVPVLALPQGRKGPRCTQCHLAFNLPIPARNELPLHKRCPECLKHDRIQELTLLDYGLLWCSYCNYSEHWVTAAQRARIDSATRLAVGGCYGNACRRPKVKGGKSSGRNRGKGNKGYSITTPLNMLPVKQPARDTVLERSATKRKKS